MISQKTLKKGKVWELTLDLRDGDQRRTLRKRFDCSARTRTEVERLEDLLKKAWAEGWLDQALEAADRPAVIKKYSGRTLFKDYAADWLDWYPASVGRGKSRKDKEPVVNDHLIPFFGNLAIADIKPTDRLRFREQKLSETSCRGKPYTAKRIHEYEVVLSTILKCARNDDLIPFNPCERVRSIPMRERRPEKFTNFYWPQDFIKFLEAAKTFTKKTWHLIFMTCYETGARQGELWALEKSDFTVDLKSRGIIHIHKSVDQEGVVGPTKAHDERRQMLTPELTELLQAHIKKFPFCKLLFPNRKWKHRQSNSMDVAFAQVAEKATVHRISMHGIRHTAATHLAMQGASEEQLRRFLGHSESTNTLRRYIHLAKTADRRIPLMLEAIYRSGGMLEEDDNLVVMRPWAVVQGESAEAQS